MQNYHLILECDASNSFYCQRAAQSVDLDTEKKLRHEIKINADLEKKYNVGLIVGSSGSGKTTLAKKIFGSDAFEKYLDEDIPIIDQFSYEIVYEDRVRFLTGVGLSSIPCWIKPPKFLSNGQRFRAEIALQMANLGEKTCVIDEWTSVVDRTVAKAMSNRIQKFVRREKKRLVLLSCHYDIIEWLNPDWIIDCNKQEFTDYRNKSVKKKKNSGLMLDNVVGNPGGILASITI